jgi:hypothetical protein
MPPRCSKRLPPSTINRIPEAIFSYFNRNAFHDEEQYGMPLNQLVEIRAQLRV